MAQCVVCGKETSNKCTNCSGTKCCSSLVFLVLHVISVCAAPYCSKTCQRADWPTHKRTCKIASVEENRPDKSVATSDGNNTCWVCLEKDVLSTGCGCRGSQDGAHIRCIIKFGEHRGNEYLRCPTCLQYYTGPFGAAIADGRIRYSGSSNQAMDLSEWYTYAARSAVMKFDNGDRKKGLQELEKCYTYFSKRHADDHSTVLEVTNK